MTTTATETSVQSRPLFSQNVALTIAAFEAIVLLFLPFLPRGPAGVLLTQVAVILLLVVGVIDFVTLRVPNLVIYPSILFALVGTALVDFALLDNAALGGVALLGIMFVLAIIGRGSMGMGDVKFAGFMGCILGWRVGIIALVSGFAFGAVVALILLIARLKGRKDALPLTPFLAAGAMVWVLVVGTLLSSKLLN